LTGRQRASIIAAMLQVRSAQLWWWRWSPATHAARPTNG